MKNYKILSDMLGSLKSDDKEGLRKIFETFEEIGSVAKGIKGYKMAPPQIVVLIAQGMQALREVFSHELNTKESCFIIENLNEYLILPTFEKLCSEIIKNHENPTELAVVIKCVENYPDVCQNKKHFLFADISLAIETRYKKSRDLFPLLKASKEPKFQEDIWFKIEPEKLKYRDLSKLLDSEWSNIHPRIYKDIMGLIDIETATPSILLKSLYLGNSLSSGDLSIKKIMSHMGRRILSITDDAMILMMAYLDCDTGDEKMEKEFLEKILLSDPDLEKLQFFRDQGGFLEMENLDSYLEFNHNTCLLNIGHQPMYLDKFSYMNDDEKDWIDEMRLLPYWTLYLLFKQKEKDSIPDSE